MSKTRRIFMKILTIDENLIRVATMKNQYYQYCDAKIIICDEMIPNSTDLNEIIQQISFPFFKIIRTGNAKMLWAVL